MNSWKIILATLVIFGVGVITGAIYISHLDQSKTADAAKAPATTNTVATNTVSTAPVPVTMEQRRLEFMRKVSRELDLSPEQRTNIDNIVHAQQEQIKKIWEPVWESISPRLREQMTNAHDEIVAELTPEQRLKFEDLMKHPPAKKDTNQPPKKITPESTNSINTNLLAAPPASKSP